MSDLDKISSVFNAKIDTVKTKDDLQNIKTEFFGKNGQITQQFKTSGSLDPDKRKEFASNLNKIKDDLTSQLEQKNIEIENKGSNLTVHFRNSTIDRKEINKIMLEIVKYEPKLILLEGKEVLEVKPLSHNKGTAISYYMKTKPFIKRRPIFIGDDISDEDGFETVNKIGGWSVRVGNYKRSKANFFLPNVKSVHEMMKQLLKSR